MTGIRSTIVTTQTFTQIKTHAQKYHAKNNAEVQWKYRERLLPDTKTDIQKNDTTAHQKRQESLSPDMKARIQEHDTTAHQKCRESLSPDTKARM